MKSGCIETYSGIMIDPLNPDVELIRIEDIAHSLAMQCRFNGHCKKFYSVAEHSVNTLKVAERLFSDQPLIAKFALLHDASEAYLCDIPRPIKASFFKYLEWERSLSAMIYQQFVNEIPSKEEEELVLKADNMMLKTESFGLAESKGLKWGLVEDKADDIRLFCYSPEEAKQMFIEEFERLLSK